MAIELSELMGNNTQNSIDGEKIKIGDKEYNVPEKYLKNGESFQVNGSIAVANGISKNGLNLTFDRSSTLNGCITLKTESGKEFIAKKDTLLRNIKTFAQKQATITAKLNEMTRQHEGK